MKVAYNWRSNLVVVVLLRLSSFIVSEDIISIFVDQNFTMNVTGMHMVLDHCDSFTTRLFFTLATIFGHLDGVGSHKNTRYE